MKRTLLAVVVAVAVLLGATSAFAEDVYVKTRYAKLRAGMSSSDATVGKLKHGTKLTVLEKKGGFLRVRTADGKEGWITKSWTTPKMKSRSKFLESLGAAARGGGGKDISYTAGARGLSSQAQAFAGDTPDMKSIVAAIERLEKISFDDDEIDQFLKDGKLGDYKE